MLYVYDYCFSHTYAAFALCTFAIKYITHDYLQKSLIFVIFIFFKQASIVNLTGLKSDLFNINVEIHNFLADLCVTRRKDSHNSTPQQRIPLLKRETITSTTLRDKVVALYAMWDEAFHR